MAILEILMVKNGNCVFKPRDILVATPVCPDPKLARGGEKASRVSLARDGGGGRTTGGSGCGRSAPGLDRRPAPAERLGAMSSLLGAESGFCNLGL